MQMQLRCAKATTVERGKDNYDEAGEEHRIGRATWMQRTRGEVRRTILPQVHAGTGSGPRRCVCGGGGV